ncbi:hypothetical protein PTTG_10280 [Puccinia triticina 1-1 BBBD Race 1]|uniref:Uncharacterized protein n=1 Tax=Puccinia triticina (isolate 1-1 / race 1 (BBBD)) TaxID=630390 RepID=A0A0C4FAN7_PUCT1|nr:hypothetical protein PTTG_10280 [Puccinia triticina 1-1 BBBD Race 1]
MARVLGDGERGEIEGGQAGRQANCRQQAQAGAGAAGTAGDEADGELEVDEPQSGKAASGDPCGGDVGAEEEDGSKDEEEGLGALEERGEQEAKGEAYGGQGAEGNKRMAAERTKSAKGRARAAAVGEVDD